MTWTPRHSFYLVLGALGLASLYVAWDYLGLMFLAVILVIVFEPVYDYLLSKVKRPAWAALLTTLTVLGVIVVPLAVLVGLAVQQARLLVIGISSQIAWQTWQQSQIMVGLERWAPEIGQQIETALQSQEGQVTQLIQTMAQSLGQVVTKGIIPAVTGTVQVVADSLIFVLFLGYLFPVKKQLFSRLASLSPLAKGHHARFMRRFEVVIRATVKSTLLVGLVQGVMGAVMLTILKVPGAAVWGLMMGLAAFIPLGSGVIWWPIGVILILSGRWLTGLIWLGYGILVISTVDNVIRSRVLGTGESALPALLTLMAVLGGVKAFGFMGFILGPIIVALFLTALQVYLEERPKKAKA
ncbi:hypothetical protein A2W24_05100 [Microgenomates group bacterium RBG_16_45_19]|nr:MAG: hypothetical protein A2W24_05100 [Microgenomates group bacterium RBG_16_45_19]